jgi:hypothetical protein
MKTSAALQLTLDPKEDELKCHFEMVREDVPTMSVFDLPPPIFPGRIVILTFQVLEPEKVHAIFVGNTSPLQAGFVKHNIKGKTVKLVPEDPYGDYMRVLEYLSLADEEKFVEQLKGIFEDVLQNSPLVIRVKESKHDLEKLKKAMDHFKASSNIRIEL